MSASIRYQPTELIALTSELFRRAGCDGNKPDVIAAGLVEADLLGHTTHGLQLAAAYLNDLDNGKMTATGEPSVVADRGTVATWDGRRLPGVWLAARAVDHAVAQARTYGTAVVAVRRSHHIACLAAFLQRATDQGMMVTIASSDPAVASIAPFGGTRPVYTPDPIAIGIPTGGDPILVDISASITTNGMAARLRKEGRRFPGAWVIDALGQPTDDPDPLFADPPGTILPIGGLEYGHKGFGLGLMIEALTQGLSGFGRADPPEGWGASFYVQVVDPSAFGGIDEFRRQTDHLVSACLTSPPIPGGEPVRIPGHRGLVRKRRAMTEGLELYPGIRESLEPWAERFGLKFPKSLPEQS